MGTETASVEAIAAKLTTAQRDALLQAEVRDPPSFMPSYHMIRMAARRMSGAETEMLRSLGLVTLPVCEGPRSGWPVYSGEIHALGLAVRAHLAAQVQA